jgi:hypothetical protein
MAPSRVSVNEKAKKKIGRPFVGSTLIGVRVPPAELAALDAWIAALDDPKPTRQEALRMLARHSLKLKVKR